MPLYSIFTRRFLTSRNFKIISTRGLQYDMPTKYRDSFFLANASFFDNSNWYIHNAYEKIFPELIVDVRKQESSYDDTLAIKKIIRVIKGMDLCNELLDINFQIMRKNQKPEILRGYRAHHGLNVLNKPCLGGLRLTNELHKDHCKALAVLSSYRNICAGVNLGGAHGGIKVPRAKYDEVELKHTVQTYAKQLAHHNFCGKQIDIIEPDMYTNPVEMAWIIEALSGERVKNNCSIGYPPEVGGVLKYENVVSETVLHILNYFLNNDEYMAKAELSKGIKNKTFVVQGLGKSGKNIAIAMEQAGAKCVGVKEVDAYMFEQNGIPLLDLIAYKEKNGSIEGFSPLVKPYDHYDVFKEEFEILILAANHKSVQCFLADKMKVKLLVEVSNGAITPSAYKILIGHNKLVLPDIMVNSGCSIAAFLEHKQSVENKIPFASVLEKASNEIILTSLEPDDSIVKGMVEKVTDSLEKDIIAASKELMTVSIKEILEIAEKQNLGLDLRTAAYINAIKKLFKIVLAKKAY